MFNGDAGKVSSIDQENEYLYVKFEDGWTSCYEFDEQENLSLAYALTIHKSQGSEYPVVVIPVYDYIPMLTTMNLLYTGITRAKKAILLIGDKKKLYQIIKNVSATKRNRTGARGKCNLYRDSKRTVLIGLAKIIEAVTYYPIHQRKQSDFEKSGCYHFCTKKSAIQIS